MWTYADVFTVKMADLYKCFNLCPVMYVWFYTLFGKYDLGWTYLKMYIWMLKVLDSD